MKLFLPLCVIFALALSQVSANCSADCPDTEEVVWALGGGCNVFRNKCYFDKENCHRKPPLTITTKEECQKFCADACIQVYQPVGGTYRGKTRTFGNQCEKNAHICSTGETYL
ncbi:uncharacterized protein [Drosophila tropicalis]|uniref:uncharacterized protein n=1 Tax=Drosophila tropicalis TaxID=46794 RepID=UPI0035AB9EBD